MPSPPPAPAAPKPPHDKLSAPARALRKLGLARDIDLALHLLLGFGAGWLVAEILGVTGVLRGVLIIQATMPVAVFNYLLAVRYRKSPEEVAGAVRKFKGRVSPIASAS